MFRYTLEVNFDSQKHANIVHGTVSVDEELMKDVVKRELFIEGNLLRVVFQSENLRFLRSSVKGMTESISLSLQTIIKFENFK